MGRKRITIAVTTEQLRHLRKKFAASGTSKWQDFLRQRSLEEDSAHVDALSLLTNAVEGALSVDHPARTRHVAVLLTLDEYEHVHARSATWGLSPALYVARNLTGAAPWQYIERATPERILTRALHLTQMIERKTP